MPPGKKIYLCVRTRKSFCSQVKCQMIYPRGQKCQPGDLPRVFKSGVSDIEACQCGCYELYEHTIRKDDDENENANTRQEDNYMRAPFCQYSYIQDACIIQDNGLFALGIDDYMRTDTHPLPRVDTIGTGFDYVDSDNNFNDTDFDPEKNRPYIDLSGNESFRFKVNKYYCDDFQLKFTGTKCNTTVFEDIFGFVISSALYKSCQYGIRYAATGVTNTQIQKLNLPPITHEPQIKTVDDWYNNINEDAFFLDPDLTLEDLGIPLEHLHLIFTTEYGGVGRLVEPLLIYQHISDYPVDYEKRNKGRLPQFQYDAMTGQRIIDEYEMMGLYKYIRETHLEIELDDPHITYEKFIERATNFFHAVISNLPEMGKGFLIGYSQDLGSRLAIKGLTISERYLKNTITPSLIAMVQRHSYGEAVQPVIRAFSAGLRTVLKTGRVFLKSIEYAGYVGVIFDLLDIFIDFFNMNRLMDDGTVQHYSEISIEQVRKAYGQGTVEYSAIMFMLMCQDMKLHEKWSESPQSIYKLKCLHERTEKYMLPIEQVTRFYENNDKTLEWIAEYIFTLEENSDLININWEDEEEYSSKEVRDACKKLPQDVYVNAINQYDMYSKTFQKRYIWSFVAIVITLVLFFIVLYLNSFWILTLVVFIGAITSSICTFATYTFEKKQ